MALACDVVLRCKKLSLQNCVQTCEFDGPNIIETQLKGRGKKLNTQIINRSTCVSPCARVNVWHP